MKQVFTTLVVLFTLSVSCFAQSTTSELVFKNPVLVSGTAGKDGAVYKFSNVTTGVDATIKIADRSNNAVVVSDIDVDDMGWDKAFQPKLGISGNVSSYQNWWMDFELRFYVAGTSTRKKLSSFKATAIDLDGDGLSVQEYLQMNNTTTVALSPVSYLTTQTTSNLGCTYDNIEYNKAGTDLKFMGSIRNYGKIDTLGTQVMATFSFTDKDMIAFRYGAKSGYYGSDAGERLNSLWFRAFNLTVPSRLPIFLTGFTATYNKKKVNLNWSAYSDETMGAFVVERSIDGINFQTLAQRPATFGNDAYEYSDEQFPATASIVYYRIQSREKSGEVKYSEIKVIRLTKETAATISLYPNPVQKTANLTLPAAWQSQPVTVSIYNASGAEVQRKTITAASQTEALDLGTLPKGFYVVKAACNGQWSEERIVKN